MKLQILVPQYNEDDNVIKYLLDSISIQEGIDFNEIGVIIVNDGSDTHLTPQLLNNYPFTIRYEQIDHQGVSAARQHALDLATADYVMFCDADDKFFNAVGLFYVFKEMNDGFEMLCPSFIEELRVNNEVHNFTDYIVVEGLNQFIHGKVFNRKFLLDNDIKWNKNLTIHEDCYFAWLCNEVCEKPISLSQPYYLWKWRDNSVCRSSPLYLLETYQNCLDSTAALLEELTRRGKTESVQIRFVNSVWNAYYSEFKLEYTNPDNKELLLRNRKIYAQFFNKFKELWYSAPQQMVLQSSMAVRNDIMRSGMTVENMLFDDWFKMMLSLIDAVE